MKTFKDLKWTITGDKITMTATIVDRQFSPYFGKQHTIPHTATSNPNHYRHLQLTDEAIFIKSPGRNCGFAITKEDAIALATAVEPMLSYAPMLRSASPDTLEVVISSELTPDFQWEVSDDAGKTWIPIAGQKTNKLDKSTVKNGQCVRLVASSEAGSMTTEPMIIR